MKSKYILAIIIAKLISKIIKILNIGNGITFPGYIARLIDKDILSNLSKLVKKDIFVVIGTNGKTTTNSLLYHMLINSGKTVLINKTGANMLNGIVGSFVLSQNITKGVDYACIEVDELASIKILDKLNPSYLIFTNISRDQLDRYGDTSIILDKIKKTIIKLPNMKLIINADDINLFNTFKNINNKKIYFGIEELNKNFEQKKNNLIDNDIFCPKCHNKLIYSQKYFFNLGSYKCGNCNFKRPKLDYSAKDIFISDNKCNFSINNHSFMINSNMIYNIYNVLSVISLLYSININKDIYKNLYSFNFENNREKSFIINNCKVQLLLAKNPVSFSQKLEQINKDKSKKNIIIQINDNDQDSKDISWLWDVDFKILEDTNISSVYCHGSRKYEIGLRLKYSNIKSKFIDNLKKSIIYITNSDIKNLYIIVNYSGLYKTYNLLNKLNNKNIKIINSGINNYQYDIFNKREINYKLKVAHLYPNLLNLYGDGGNIISLKVRGLSQCIDVVVDKIFIGTTFNISEYDIIVIGGGTDNSQKKVIEDLYKYKDELKNFVQNDGIILAICAGYQLLGKTYITDDFSIDGLGILDIDTICKSNRLVGNIIIKSEKYKNYIVGFENHGGRTFLKNNETFGKVIYGKGNCDDCKKEGVIYKNVFATYLHGPILIKNYFICDDILKKAVSRKYNIDFKFNYKIDNSLEKMASNVIIDMCKIK